MKIPCIITIKGNKTKAEQQLNLMFSAIGVSFKPLKQCKCKKPVASKEGEVCLLCDKVLLR